MSPWVSARQERWGNSPAGHAALGDAKVKEFNDASRGVTFGGGQRAAMSKSKRGTAAARIITRLARKNRTAKPAVKAPAKVKAPAFGGAR